MSKFIVIEGVDYVGKTTFQNYFIEQLKRCGLNVTETREPGGGPVGEAVRKILVSMPMDRDVWGLLLGATRIEHCRHVIKPALERGDIVVSSRYITSTYVYQKEALPYLKDFTLKHPEILEPDFIILCEAPIETIKARKKQRDIDIPPDLLDEAYMPHLAKDMAEYRKLVSLRPEASYVVDTSRPVEDYAMDVYNILTMLRALS